MNCFGSNCGIESVRRTYDDLSPDEKQISDNLLDEFENLNEYDKRNYKNFEAYIISRSDEAYKNNQKNFKKELEDYSDYVHHNGQKWPKILSGPNKKRMRNYFLELGLAYRPNTEVNAQQVDRRLTHNAIAVPILETIPGGKTNRNRKSKGRKSKGRKSKGRKTRRMLML